MKNNLSRRKFLQSSLLASGATMLPSVLLKTGNRGPKHLGLQLWSVRENMNKDPKGAIEALAKMGYKEVEPFGFDAGKLFGLGYSDFSKLLKDNGMTMHSTHCAFKREWYAADKNEISDMAKKTIDNAAGLGLDYVIYPWMPEDDRKQIDTMVRYFQLLGAYAKKAGIRFAYHNHDFEYTQKGPDGRLLIEHLLQDVPADVMAMEMDLYWVNFAGFDPVQWFRSYPGRWELCHVKDMANSEKKETIEVGDGTIDFHRIFDQKSLAGLKYFIIELENYRTTPMEGVEKARKGLLKVWG